MTDKLDIEFKNNVNNVKNINIKPNNETLLFLYSHYKQATIGNCNIAKPKIYDVKGTYKYDAWNKLNGMDTNTAKKLYINKIKEL